MNHTNDNKGCLLKDMEGDSECELPQYSLPPKSIVKRPRKSKKKRSRSSWRKSCFHFCRYCSNVVLVLVIAACLLSIALLFWFSLRLYRDAENLSRRLTIEINQVQAEQGENIEKCNSLKVIVEDHVQKSGVWQKYIISLRKQLSLSLSKIGLMNNTLIKMSYQLQDANNKVMLKTKVDALQKGMADTGAEMTKLSDQVKQIEKKTSLQLSAIKNINSGLRNVSRELSNTTGKSKTLFYPLNYILDHFNDVDENQESTEPQNFKKSSLLSDRSLIRNVSEMNEIKKQININGEEIKLIWDELEIQNFTILGIQERKDMTKVYRPPDPQYLPRETTDESLEKYDDDQSRTGNRKDLQTKYKSRRRKSDIVRKEYGDYFNS